METLDYLKYTRSCPRARIPFTFRREFTRFEEPKSDFHARGKTH